MGGVNASPNYWGVVNIGDGNIANGVTQTTKQGGIVSIYYLGAIVGAFIGQVSSPLFEQPRLIENNLQWLDC
jgi:uncharacterized membrane protein YeaQ/YmgE (transglycosylase-associated protein family)